MHYKQLTLEQRYQIKAFLTARYSICLVADLVKVHKSTIYREIGRNKMKRSYDPSIANEKALLRRKYSRKKKRLSDEIKSLISNGLKAGWSPEQICGHCKNNGLEMISHESIYRYLASNKMFGGDLCKYLRRGKKRKNQYGSLVRAQPIKNRTSIEQRPPEVERRNRIGDWEGDLVIGKNHKGALLTVVERRSRYVLAKFIPSKKAAVVADALIELLEPLKNLVHTITFDNGSEFALHEKIASQLGATVYFAHPYSSWERGTNENTNGLIRQFIPKGTSFDGITDGFVHKMIKSLNSRPRKVLGFRFPETIFAEGLIV